MKSGSAIERGKSPEISLIVPVYNAEPYLERCLDSLLAQDMTNVEFVVINNGSTDKSLEIVQDYASRDSRFIVLSQENQGPRGSRNTGLSAASGAYIAFVDADDFVDKNFCSLLYSAICTTDSDVAICDYAMTYRDHEEPDVLGWRDETVLVSDLGPEMFYLRYVARAPVVWNKLYRRELIENNHICFEVQHGEDMLFNLRLMPYIRQICTIKESSYHYVQRVSSVSRSQKNHLAERSVNILECFLAGETEFYSRNMLFFCFACIFTGFLFSTDCVGQKIAYYREQVSAYRKASFFSDFCKTISQTDELKAICTEQVISKRFYQIQKLLFTLCHKGCDTLAAYFMWFCSKLIIVKKRYFLRNRYE